MNNFTYDIINECVKDNNNNLYELNKVVKINEIKYYFRKYTKKNGEVSIYVLYPEIRGDKLNKSSLIYRLRGINKTQLIEIDTALRNIGL